MMTVAARRTQLQRVGLILPVCAALAWVVGTIVSTKDIETLRASVILSLLVVASLVIFWQAARSDPEGRLLFGLLFASFALKLLAGYFRFYTGLLADAIVYNNVGREIAQQLSYGYWPQTVRPFGTPMLRLMAGLFYFVAGPTMAGITIFWAWLALMGMMFFYKAFTIAFPQGNRRLYMVLVLLYPSLLLWTSSLSKDAPMMFFGGLAAFGLARFQRGFNIIGFWCLGVGGLGMFIIRPHIAGIFAIAVAISFLTNPVGAGRMTPVIRIGLLVIFLGIAAVAAVFAGRSIGLDSLEVGEVEAFIGTRQVETGERAGSAFAPIDTSSPLGLVLLIPTVLFRPFPFEANNLNALIASMEGMGLMALIVYRFRSVRAAITAAFRSGVMMQTVVYALMFIYIFSAISNFGTIARQRVQIFPYVFMWIAYLDVSRRSSEG